MVVEKNGVDHNTRVLERRERTDYRARESRCGKLEAFWCILVT